MLQIFFRFGSAIGDSLNVLRVMRAKQGFFFLVLYMLGYGLIYSLSTTISSEYQLVQLNNKLYSVIMLSFPNILL